MPSRRRLEVEFFRALNRVVAPAVRAGFASPRLAPGGLILLETTGRKSGLPVRVPLAATRLQGHVVVATFRGGRSQWVQNALAHREVRYWLGGRPIPARALVLQRGSSRRLPSTLPTAVRWFASLLVPYTTVGWAFAILVPRPGARAAGSPRFLQSRRAAGAAPS